MRTTEKVLLFRRDKRKRDLTERALGGDKVKLVFFTLPTGEDLSSIMEETKEGGLPNMAVDDDSALLCQKKKTPSEDSSGSTSAANPSDVDCHQLNSSGSRASSVFTDLTEISTSSASSSHASSSVIPRHPSTPSFQQQAQPPPPRAGSKHLLFKSSSSFQLSGCQGNGLPGSRVARPLGSCGSFGGGGCVCNHQSPAPCHLSRFHPHHNPLSPSRILPHQHHCGGQVPLSPTGQKMGHFQFGGQIGAQALQRQIQCGSPAHHQQGSSSAFQPLGGQFQPPVRSASAVGLASIGGGIGCYPNGCCSCCDSRFCRKQIGLSSGNIHDSHEILMSPGSHTLEAPPPPGPPENSPPALTAEGLSWRRLHMSRAKLKATATTSELLSGFAMVAMVELQINEPTNVPEWLFVLFAVCTTVLVSVHIFALMISTYILPNVDAVSKMQQCNQGGDLQSSYTQYSRHTSYSSCTGSFSSGTGPVPAVLESPHERMRTFIELAWAFSTVLGLFLFLVELAILCWVKFWDHSFTAAWAATVIVIPVLVLFLAFAAHFYHSLVAIKCDTSASDMRDLERMKADLDAAARDASVASNV